MTSGLGPGSSDLIGYKTITITPDMVGCQVAVFAAIEVKTPTDHKRQHQVEFLAAIKEAGGIVGFASSPQDLRRILG